jgi:hypothetical protein
MQAMLHRYFSLRSRLRPPSPDLPIVVLAALTAAAVMGSLLDLSL